MRYQAKPVFVEAYQLPDIDEDPSEALIDFLNGEHEDEVSFESARNGALFVETPYHSFDVLPQEWLIKDPDGNFFPLTDADFQSRYQPAPAPGAPTES